MPKALSSWLLLAAALALCACGKRTDAEDASSRGLKVEAYDAPVAKAPPGAKLETMKPHPETAPSSAAPAASDLAPPASDAAPAAKPQNEAKPQAEAKPPLPVVRVAGPVIPPGREAGAAPYDPFAKGAAAAAAETQPQTQAPGFHLTVPVCRQAERTGDPLAKTPECAGLLKAATDQAKACKQAFEAGDDKSALSPACRQAAGFR